MARARFPVRHGRRSALTWYRGRGYEVNGVNQRPPAPAPEAKARAGEGLPHRHPRRRAAASGSSTVRDGVSARKIAQPVGVSPTALYLHFRGIDDVLEQLRMEGHELLAGYLAPPVPSARARAHPGHGPGVPPFRPRAPRAVRAHVPRRAPTAPRREAVVREMFTLMLLRDVVEAGIARGELRADLDPMVVTNALWAEIHGVTSLDASRGSWSRRRTETSEPSLDAVLDAIGAGWLAPAAHAEPSGGRDGRPPAVPPAPPTGRSRSRRRGSRARRRPTRVPPSHRAPLAVPPPRRHADPEPRRARADRARRVQGARLRVGRRRRRHLHRRSGASPTSATRSSTSTRTRARSSA